jgi:spore coat polysaccharide biosynthesis protein SpsF
MTHRNNVVAIIEARMTSSRLPGKHLLEANGKPMIMHLVDRLKQVSMIDQIVIATTTNVTDEPLVKLAKDAAIGVFRGSEEDVMGRVLGASEAFSADVVCEVTGDCPIIDPALVNQVIETYLINDADYVNNGKHGIPGGMNAQVFSWLALKRSYEMTSDPLDREHVTLHIKRHPELFRAIYLVADKSNRWPELELTLDEQDDYILIKRVIEHFGIGNQFFTCSEVINLMREKSDWIKINAHVQRKGDS